MVIGGEGQRSLTKTPRRLYIPGSFTTTGLAKEFIRVFL